MPGVRKVFQNNEHGFIVEPGNVSDLRDKLEQLITNPPLRTKMGRNARTLVEDIYNKEKLNKKLEDTLLDLLK